LLTKPELKELNKMHATVNDLVADHRRQKMERWLSPPDPSENFNKALKQRHGHSGLWFLQSETFIKWKVRRNSFLWLYGIPGCGKTILSSTIIKTLEYTLPSQPLLYFYFDFNDRRKQELESMVRSLIIQLYSKLGNTLKELDSLFSSCDDGRRQPSSESLYNAFLKMMEQVEEVWIVLDALDECTTRRGSPTEGVISWIGEVLNSEQRNIHVLVTSRPEQDIKSGILKFAHHDDTVPIQSSLISEDIRAYVHTRVREDDRLKRWRSQPEVQNEIESRLMKKADGM